MSAKAGFEAWRERNPSLPFPDEFRIMNDGSMKAIGQPDYYSRSLTLLNEDALTQTLAGYM